MTSSISPGESRNSGMVGWIPSAKGRCRSATPYLRFKTRNGEAFVTGLALTLSMAWHCAQCTRTYLKPRLSAGDCSARAGPLSHNSITPSVIAGHRAWDISVPFSSVVSVLHNRVGTSLGGLQGRPVLCLRVVDEHGGAVARDRRLPRSDRHGESNLHHVRVSPWVEIRNGHE